MSTSSEEISKYFASSTGRTDSNLANDALHLGGIAAEEFATQRYVQDYIEHIRVILKEYIDTQDLSILQQAKAYTDLIINSQDFSSFAKLTDIQALSQRINAEIARVEAEQKQYTDNKIQLVVNDVNDNFNDVNSAITNLSNRTQSQYNELFTSVSNGKASIAEAITDKGVQTSASDTFNTMATNIRSIPSGGGGTDTSDATATANDILQGKIAYVKGEKIYGRYAGKDESESGEDINPSNPYPDFSEVQLIYGSKPTSVSAKIMNGVSSAFEGIYDISEDGRIVAYYDSSDSKIKFLKAQRVNNQITYSSQYITENGSGQRTTYISPEYSLEELDIEGEIQKIAFSRMNIKTSRSSYECKLAIQSILDGILYINVFTFSTEITQNSLSHYICQLYTNNEVIESQIIYRKWKINVGNKNNDSYNGAFKFSPYLTTNNEDYIAIGVGNATRDGSACYLFGFALNEYYPSSTYEGYGMITKDKLIQTGDWLNRIYDFEFHCNNRLIEVFCNRYITIKDTQSIVVLSENRAMLSFNQIAIPSSSYCIKNDGLYAVKDGILYSMVIDYINGNISFNQIGNLGVSFTTSKDNCAFAFDDSYFIANGSVYTINYTNCIATLIDSNNYNIVKMLASSNSWISLNESIYSFTSVNYDDKEVTGLIYNGEMFYKQVYPAKTLTAKQIDVNAGKTYIGYLGIPETGTLEVN